MKNHQIHRLCVLSSHSMKKCGWYILHIDIIYIVATCSEDDIATFDWDTLTESGPDVAGVAVPSASDNTLSLTLFHHDLVHEVLKVEEGHKISLTFDVCVKS